MRVLCTTLGSPSHGRAQLPLLRALAAAGHEVRVATNEELAPLFRHDDLHVLTCLPEFSPQAFADSQDLAGMAAAVELGPDEQQAAMVRFMVRTLSGPMAKQLREVLRPVAQEFRPHLILRDGMDLSSCLIAEELGIPQLPTPSGASNVLDPAEVHPGLNALRTELGLPAQEDPLSIVRHGRVDYVPADFSFARYLPGPLAYRQTVNVDRSSVLPQWVAELPTDRPLVWAALGTALPMMQQRREQGQVPEMPFELPDPAKLLQSIVEPAAVLDECTVIVATSGAPVDTTALPPHVHVTDRLPQPLLLECVDLFLTHGGFNSIREALRTATPLAVLPQFGDQPANAERVEELGLGRHITDPTPDGIAAVCRQVLADPGAAATARRARLAMLALPEIESAVADLERLVGERA
ncbi:glycosyltransferase [Streptomyces purpurogeneiscleroticus]|uniref:glycosyltransferase n=1 Tax=Streptomyces purpurogeneiscleroticus TaxID=68259 RepID=UPI001CBEC9D1|nr:glycosyltransferase [Streptomyces purpurogeneiscleroticus]MBZ4015938.1 glycosyl transferase [Streptomyces purpurogeneiscleroticus]